KYQNTQSYDLPSLKNFKKVYLKLYEIGFNRFQEIVRNCFQCIEVLFLSIEDDVEYLDAKQWEKLISSNMHNLRNFHMHHNNIGPYNRSKYHDLIYQCTSSFWIEKLFYISSTQFNENPYNYFLNADELTIENSFTGPDSIVEAINRVVPLYKVTKLCIKFFDFPVEQLIKILLFLCSVHTLKTNALLIADTDREVLQRNENLKYVSKTNKIKILILDSHYALVNIQFIINFPCHNNRISFSGKSWFTGGNRG
ncbi:unnamed protein product, partial [Rotaria sp. Silwood1]